MPAYNSTIPSDHAIANTAMLPLNTKFRGPAYTTDEYDIIDESFDLFRANSLFRNFEIKSTSDRTLIYIILFISECLQRLSIAKPAPNPSDANRMLNTLALESFSIPGEPSFPLNSIYAAPKDKYEAETLRGYLTQVRQETAARVIIRVYQNGQLNKWWMCFSKRRFMNKSLA